MDPTSTDTEERENTDTIKNAYMLKNSKKCFFYQRTDIYLYRNSLQQVSKKNIKFKWLQHMTTLKRKPFILKISLHS